VPCLGPESIGALLFLGEGLGDRIGSFAVEELGYRNLYKPSGVSCGASRGELWQKVRAYLDIPLRPLEQRYSILDILVGHEGVLLESFLLAGRQRAEVEFRGAGHDLDCWRAAGINDRFVTMTESRATSPPRPTTARTKDQKVAVGSAR